jgi:hypothetical protein
LAGIGGVLWVFNGPGITKPAASCFFFRSLG